MSCVLSTLLRPWTVWLLPALLALLCQALAGSVSVTAATALYVYGRFGEAGPIAEAAAERPAAQAGAAGAYALLKRPGLVPHSACV